MQNFLRHTGMHLYPEQHLFSSPHSSGITPQLSLGAEVELNIHNVGCSVGVADNSAVGAGDVEGA